MHDHLTQPLRSTPFPAHLLVDSRHARGLHSALWLYLVLRAAAAPDTGRLQTTHDELGRALGVGTETVSSLLGRLRAHGYVETRRVHGQVEIRVCHWQTNTPRAAGRGRPRVRDPEPAPQNSLAFEIAEAFDDLGSLARYEDLVESYPEAAVQRAFRETRLMPQDRVRKSRGALFTYLLKNHAYDDNDQADD